MSITDWPEEERPRERLLRLGPSSLSDAELLAIFLRTGVPGTTALDLARELLTEYGGLRGLMSADLDTFSRRRGLGPAKYAQLRAALEMGHRHLWEKIARGDHLQGAADTKDYVRARLGGYPWEVFACLFLDNRHRVIDYEELFRGTVDGANVHPREVVRRCIHHNAAAVILAHNHPSGNMEPSQADIRITERLKQALALVDIRVLDHIIIGDKGTTSLAERGLL